MACVGRTRVVTKIWGFRKLKQVPNTRVPTVLDVVDLTLPHLEMDTQAFWFEVPRDCARDIESAGLSVVGGLHGASHVVRARRCGC